MKVEHLKIADLEIEVNFKNIKNLHLSVHPPYGRVTIASPDFYSIEKVKIYAASKLAWIRKEQRKFQMQVRESERMMITQESHYLFGERYLLKLVEGPRNTIHIKGNKLILTTKNRNDLEVKRRILYTYYRKVLRDKLNELIENNASKMKLDLPLFQIRSMKTKWGSCAADNNRLGFNIELVKKPVECIEYVVIHELVHLIERNHNKNFIHLMNNYMPNWRVYKKILNELPLSITPKLK